MVVLRWLPDATWWPLWRTGSVRVVFGCVSAVTRLEMAE
jgi:hypothetical protein